MSESMAAVEDATLRDRRVQVIARRVSAVGAPIFRFWQQASWGLLLAVLVIAVVVLWALVPDLFTSAKPSLAVPVERLKAPSWQHWFGTDYLGRDMYSRVVHGARNSLGGAAIAVSIGLVVGTILGVVAGSTAPLVDSLIMRLMDVLLSIPSFLLALAIVVILGFGTTNSAIAIGVSFVAIFARLVRSEVVRVKRAEYVAAARIAGVSSGRILLRHVMPNSISTAVALAPIQFGIALLMISALGFLGIGTQPPEPEWGLLLSEGRNYLSYGWWLSVLPGAAVVSVVLAANQIGRASSKDGER